jgi:hypothetical protein
VSGGDEGGAASAGRAAAEGRAAPPLWDGHAGDRIADIVVDWLAGRRDHIAETGARSSVAGG